MEVTLYNRPHLISNLTTEIYFIGRNEHSTDREGLGMNDQTVGVRIESWHWFNLLVEGSFRQASPQPFRFFPLELHAPVSLSDHFFISVKPGLHTCHLSGWNKLNTRNISLVNTSLLRRPLLIEYLLCLREPLTKTLNVICDLRGSIKIVFIYQRQNCLTSTHVTETNERACT